MKIPGYQPSLRVNLARHGKWSVDPLPGETFKWIPGYEGRYEVSDLGRVRSHVSNQGTPRRRPFILRFGHNKQGYAHVRLASGTSLSTRRVNRLVAIAFLGAPPTGKDWALHRNDNNTDNRAENLYWGDINDNARDALVNGRRKAKLNVRAAADIRRRLNEGASASAIARQYDVAPGVVIAIAHNKAWRGFGDKVVVKLRKKQDGSDNDMAKLTEDEVVAIRRRHTAGATQPELALAFGVQRTNISLIVNRRTWRHLP